MILVRPKKHKSEQADYTPYFTCRDFIGCKDPEVIIAGPAETGKTLACLWKLHLCAMKYPGASIVLARKQLTDVYPSVLQTYMKKVLQPGDPVHPYGGNKRPQHFDYENGSRIWIAGLDKSSKILSAEHDLVYLNQAEEASLPDWETCTTRTTGRAGNMPYSQTIGDCNPGPPTHWIISRSRGEALTRFNSTHKDNPTLINPVTGKITKKGKETFKRLMRLTGSRYTRLFKGLWSAPEGAIYSAFSEEVHVIEKPFKPPNVWPRIVGIDPLGAFVAAVWLAYDPKNNCLHAYQEYCKPFGPPTTVHAQRILDLTDAPVFQWIVGQQAERQQRVDFRAAGIPAQRPAHNDVWSGIDQVIELLTDPVQLYIHSNCVQLLSEIGDYRRKMVNGIPSETTIYNKDRYHMLDALRYAIVGPDVSDTETRIIYEPVIAGMVM